MTRATAGSILLMITVAITGHSDAQVAQPRGYAVTRSASHQPPGNTGRRQTLQHRLSSVSRGASLVDPRAWLLYDFRDRFGGTLPIFHVNRAFEQTGELPVTLRFERLLTDSELQWIEQMGVRFANAREPLLSGVYAAYASQSSLRRLSLWATLVRAEVSIPVRSPAPLHRASAETGITAARNAFAAANGRTLDGTGVTIADVDSGIFPFHPAFFRADGGLYEWVDVDADARLTLGVDGVDLNRDDQVSANEVLLLLESREASIFDSTLGDLNDTATYEPSVDWLYLDTNGNGRRDYGGAAGFVSSDPAWGEPLFILDDLDRDEVAMPAERLLRLSSSKIRYVDTGRVYWRDPAGSGQSLVDFDFGSSDDYTEQSHGTLAAGVLIAGVPNRSLELGLASGAELIAIGSAIEGLDVYEDAVDEGTDIFLTEFAPYVFVTLDGTSELDRYFDAALEDGIVTVSPAGNLASSGKHRSIDLGQGNNSFEVITDEYFSGSQALYLSVHIPSSDVVSDLTVEVPGVGEFFVPSSDPSTVQIGGVATYVANEVSPRGTAVSHITVYSNEPLPAGPYRFTLSYPRAQPAVAELYVADQFTSWARGAVFREGTNDAHTICSPSTGDSVISVAAYGLADRARAYYSSMGPLLTGGPGLEVIAPADPVTTMPALSADNFVRWAEFGGTSGAGPHVAAAVALLMQQDPEALGPAVRSRVLSGLATDQLVPAGQPEIYGNGRLNLAASLGVPSSQSNAPSVVLAGPTSMVVGTSASITLNVMDDGPQSALRARWDVGYDGVWDGEFEPVGPRVIEAAMLGVISLRVEVMDETGNIRGVAHRINVVQPSSCGCRVSERRNSWSWLWFAAPLLLARLGGRLGHRLGRRRCRASC